LMRPPPDTTDYLVPNNPCSNSNSNFSMSTERTELLSPDTCSTVSCNNEDSNQKLLEFIDERNSSAPPPVIPPRTNNFRETSFSSNRNQAPIQLQNPPLTSGRQQLIGSNMLNNNSPHDNSA